MEPQNENRYVTVSTSNTLRTALLSIESAILDFKKAVFALDPKLDEPSFDRGEVIANIMLAYRAVEDGRMRLGKVIQAADGGTSIYDKKKE